MSSASTNRYSLRRVMLVTGVLCVILITLQTVILTFAPGTGGLKQMLRWHWIISQVVSFFFLSFFFYFSANKFYKLFNGHYRARAFWGPIIMALLSYASYNLSMVLISESGEVAKMRTLVMIISPVISSSFMTGVSLVIAYLTMLRDEGKQRKILEQQKMELEMQNTQANFNFLKAQINPHFLHNTLNFFYAKALPLNEELSEGILCLSDVMRYALNEGGKDEKALLKDEIEHLGNVIRINQLRFSNNLNVQFEVEGEVGGTMVVPFVLITLVENAFKHGDLRSREHPIVIRIKVEGRKLYFYCRNKKNPGFKEISTGIGLQNILRRLDIVYGKNYTYQVHDDAEFYTTELTIDPL